MTVEYQDAPGNLMSNILTYGAQAPVLKLDFGPSVSDSSMSSITHMQTNSEYEFDRYFHALEEQGYTVVVRGRKEG